MTINKVTPPFEFFTDSEGSPLESGKIYIGVAGLDPISNPATVYWNADGTISAMQPIRTVAGIPSNDGVVSNFFAKDDYSISVYDKNNVLIYTSLSGNDPIEEFAPRTTNNYLSGTVPDLPDVVVTTGYFSHGDRGGATWRQVASEPAHDGKRQFTNGTDTEWYELEETEVSPQMLGARGDGSTDDSTAFQQAVNYQVAQDATIVVPGAVYVVNSTITTPSGTDLGSYGFNNTLRMRGEGRPEIRTTLTSGQLFEGAGFGGAPGAQYHGWRVDGIDFRGPGNSSVSFLAPANCRIPVVENCTFAGATGGVGVDFWSQASGGSFGAVVKECHFGYQDFQVGSNEVYVDVADNLEPSALLHGVRFRGPGDSSGKTNDMVVEKCFFYACIGAGVYQGFHGAAPSGTAGSANLGGSGDLRSFANTFVGRQTRRVDHDNVISATATTAVVPVPPLGINPNSNTFDEYILWIRSGTGAGQYREITGDTVSGPNRTLTVAAWDTVPDATSEYQVIASNSALNAEFGLNNIPAAHYFDHSFSWMSTNDYVEDVNAPVLGGTYATDDFAVIAPIWKGTAIQWSKRTNGETLTPAVFLATRTRGDDDVPTNSILTNWTLRRSQNTSGREPSGDVRTYENQSGGGRVNGDVVRVSTAGPLRVAASVIGGDRPKVVADVTDRTFAVGERVPIASSGSHAEVRIIQIDETPRRLINETATVVGHTGNSAAIDNDETDPKKILGYVVSANTSGNLSVVEIL